MASKPDHTTVDHAGRYIATRWLSVLFCICVLGCSEADGPDSAGVAPRSGFLLNPFDWSRSADEDDPFAERRPETWNCAPTAYFSEQLAGVWVYSVETGDCDWLTISQPTAIPVLAGDRIVVNIWHFELVAPEPAMAYLGLATRDRILVDAEEPIPSPARPIEFDFTVDIDLPIGTPLFFHLNNHGANSWHIVEVLLNPETEES